MDDAVPFGSQAYFLWLALLLAGRGADFFSTWLATPHLVLEANPIARKLGWRWGSAANVALCGVFAQWPLPAIIIATTSALVAAHNFKNAWIMRTMREQAYRLWMSERMRETPLALFLLCLSGHVVLTGAVGGALIWISAGDIGPLGIGTGIVGYAIAVLVYTLISVWRRRPRAG